jgi:hypothetical protein
MRHKRFHCGVTIARAIGINLTNVVAYLSGTNKPKNAETARFSGELQIFCERD